MVRVWDCRTGRLLERFKGHTDSVYSVAFSPNGRSIVSGALDQSLKIWDLADVTLDYLSAAATPPPHPPATLVTSHCRHTLQGHKDFVLSVAYVGTNGSFGRVDGTGAPISTLGSDGLAEVEWVISGGKDWSVYFWDARTGGRDSAQIALSGHTNSVISVAPAPSGGIFATGAGDWHAKIWRVSSASDGENSVVSGPVVRENE